MARSPIKYQQTDTVEPPAPAEDAALEPVRFTAPYGFCDEFGDRWHWMPGQVVRNPFVLALLHARLAPIEYLEG